mmetsp:Transcript_4122/g.5916  ORF Transcript_4122/g.5916 Transcript_4122/m.5916 type:complete len:407 (+) Transcript_4122:51-1271(+)
MKGKSVRASQKEIEYDEIGYEMEMGSGDYSSSQSTIETKREPRSSSVDRLERGEVDVVIREVRSISRSRESGAPASLVVPALAARAFHLPGNTWTQDWRQYILNNHPVLGLCCHHKLHPLTCCQRILVLIGSISCGLFVSNSIYLYFLTTAGSIDDNFFAVSLDANVTVQEDIDVSGTNEIVLTNYQMALWTVGTTIHSVFDVSIWFIAACGCCQTGGACEFLKSCRWIGTYIVMTVVILTVAFATFVVIFRASLEESGANISELNSAGIFDDAIDLQVTQGWESYQFLYSLCVELVLSLFLYYFIVATIFFSGILGCGRLPLLGGRPREVRIEKKRIERVRRRRTMQEEKKEKRRQGRKSERDVGRYAEELTEDDSYRRSRSNSSLEDRSEYYLGDPSWVQGDNY